VTAAESVVARERRRVAPVLAAEIETTLHDLAMPSARFAIRVEGEGSADQVTFELAANPGEPAQPLSRAASGGELSRTMLAVRLALTDAPGVLVFDEVDAGVGGAAATAVGAALAGLGHYAQVLVVTHLAQVAAQADHQVAVRKIEAGGRTRSEVTRLDPYARVVEISRMLSGSPDSESARRHARELLGDRGPAR
jgi:DNA repair protein RecN (Recombination protein N)